MSYSRHRFDDIHIGDHVVMEVVTKINAKPYTYQVSGEVRIYNGVKAVGRDGLGEGTIMVHTPRPLPTTFGSHITYPNSGSEWVKTSGDYWRSDSGSNRHAQDLSPGWVLVRDAGEAS